MDSTAPYTMGKCSRTFLHQSQQRTGIVLVDLTAAYDTVNHQTLLTKIKNMPNGDQKLVKMLQNLLSNRRFHVLLNDKKSQRHKQKNGLPQGSVLTSALFNIYTNDQPIIPNTRSFIYTDDLAITTRQHNIKNIEATLTAALENMSKYYMANPSKTQVSMFYLNNKEANKELKITWNGIDLQQLTTSLPGHFPRPGVPKLWYTKAFQVVRERSSINKKYILRRFFGGYPTPRAPPCCLLRASLIRWLR